MEEVQSLESELKKIEEGEVVSGTEAKGRELQGSEGQQDSVDNVQDSADGWLDRDDSRHRPKACTQTGADDDDYSMKHKRRGDCLIFAHSKYAPSTKIPARESAQHDTSLCERAFSKLGFEVRKFMDLTTEQFKTALEAERNRDRTDCDAFAVVFMSHGDSKDGKEILHTYDGHVDTCELWEPFVGNKCIGLAGKPKLFFIQACRGSKVDIGVGLKVSKDGPSTKKITSNYVIPAHADLLVMWASYKGMFAFKSGRLGINGSVFIHFLAEVLENEGFKPLHDLLIKVTRRVALDFESQCPNSRLDHNKQVPHTSSTLLRRVVFTPKHQPK